MGTIWVKEFTGGLDTRRMPVATSGGVLVKAQDGHISRGGEFEKRAAFVPTYTLPVGTIGLAQSFTGGLYVFGSEAPPTMPTGVTYQRLQHPDGVTALTRVLSYDLYADNIYVVGEFADGSIEHFYNGARVTDWSDGRARASFTVTGGGITPATAPSGSFEVTGGTANVANQITNIQIDGVSIINTAVTHTGNNATTAAAVAAAINSFTSSPDYTATASGQTVTITAAATGPTLNGKAIIVTETGNFTTGNFQNMAGGANTIASSLADLKVNGVSIINAPVAWTTSNEATAAAIEGAINTFTSSPDYTATVVGATVNIVAVTAGAAPNGFAVAFTLANGLTITPSSGLVLAGGQDATTTFQPGAFVRTVGTKMYSTSASALYFSGIDTPDKWTTDNVGAGFIDMAKQSSGMEQLTSIGEYQTNIAVFAERVILIEYVDPDPTLNRKVQVLKNTGTRSGLSVTQFGDNDVFYLDESGVRSLRARDASNAAATTDLGVPIDTIVTAKLKTLTDDERDNVIGLIEPTDGRFWLIMKDTIYVFSFFSGASVSAWTTYAPSYQDGSGNMQPFNVDAAVVYNRNVYVRSGDTIYTYGGLNATSTAYTYNGPIAGVAYDKAVAVAWLPYLDGSSPTRPKEWQGVDAALEGSWEVQLGMNPNSQDASDKIATLFDISYSQDKVPSIGQSTHISPRFTTTGSGYARLSAVVIHYAPDADEG